ncbi:MAG: AMP-binding protein, partial [Eubacterium sp.]|nr:AMP-binding protein [Eubacterium sp.]
MKNVLEYLEYNAVINPEKIAASDFDTAVTYSELSDISKRIGSALSKLNAKNKPVALFLEKNVGLLSAMLGVVYSGNFYSVVDLEMPNDRKNKIFETLKPAALLTDKAHLEKAKEIAFDGEVILLEDAIASDVKEDKLSAIRKGQIDTDPLYANFTSGSTGVPKGIVVCHRSVIDFINVFTKTFDINGDDVIANQAPFDFDVSVKDIYSSLKMGAHLAIVPRRLFSAPVELLDYLCEKKVTVMIWAVSALCLISTLHGLDYKTPETVKKILFSGEVMPYKHLLNWQSHLPDTMLVNLYGPTEITCNCTYHILEKGRDYSGGIPIGNAFENEDVFLLDENNQLVTENGTAGEICVRGTALALGYYASTEQTAKSFVQNPLNNHYPELIYRTGDLAVYNENGELVFSGRKDFQIKYM